MSEAGKYLSDQRAAEAESIRLALEARCMSLYGEVLVMIPAAVANLRKHNWPNVKADHLILGPGTLTYGTWQGEQNVPMWRMGQEYRNMQGELHMLEDGTLLWRDGIVLALFVPPSAIVASEVTSLEFAKTTLQCIIDHGKPRPPIPPKKKVPWWKNI